MKNYCQTNISNYKKLIRMLRIKEEKRINNDEKINYRETSDNK
ncbi:hypothetical protein QTH51_07580 [Clostridium perfringens]|nr:hypothetical protein [Clostridium perfringens]MDM0460223.1 hypothetical protein [Clostridium perfringens]